MHHRPQDLTDDNTGNDNISDNVSSDANINDSLLNVSHFKRTHNNNDRSMSPNMFSNDEEKNETKIENNSSFANEFHASQQMQENESNSSLQSSFIDDDDDSIDITTDIKIPENRITNDDVLSNHPISTSNTGTNNTYNSLSFTSKKIGNGGYFGQQPKYDSYNGSAIIGSSSSHMGMSSKMFQNSNHASLFSVRDSSNRSKSINSMTDNMQNTNAFYNDLPINLEMVKENEQNSFGIEHKHTYYDSFPDFPSVLCLFCTFIKFFICFKRLRMNLCSKLFI